MNRDTLRLLGAGHSIESICKTDGCSRAEFDAWWKSEAASRAPRCTGDIAAAVKSNATIQRDRWGIPHIFGDNQHDLYFAYGLVMAQDRLFQLDYLRRKGLGRLAEILGSDGLQFDLIVRTVGLNRIAAAELSRLPSETREVLEAFSAPD
ncbi:MAG: penicillin acylase family protein [Planctomycetia bacterium]|nr:penicillin acylase family protein [Planctomycetia bacterium]